MDDMTRFEERFEERLRAFARTGVQSVDSAAVARTVAIGHPKSAATRPARLRPLDAIHRTRRQAVSRATFAAAAIVAVIALGAAFAIGRPSPTPSTDPSPSLPGVVAPSPTSSAAATDSYGFPRSTGVWIPTGSMGTSRERVDAVRLLDGRVLVVGPATGDAHDTSAEVYDPVSGTWSATGNMLKPHEGFPATLLRDGRVLVGDIEDPAGDKNVYGAEVYDPATGTWSATGPMVEPEGSGGNSAVLLRDGRVLVMNSFGKSELYDPDSGTWTATGQMLEKWRYGHAAILLPDGSVLVAGGRIDGLYPTDSAELYDPDTGSWTAIASMHAKRRIIEAVLQPDGKVLVVGSSRGDPPSAELYDPATGAWTATGDLARPGAFYESITLLADGTMLVAGAPPSLDAELYDPDSGTWSVTGEMVTPIDGPTTLLLDGTVLVAGEGADSQLYVPAGVTPPSGLPTSAPPTPTPIPTAVSTPFSPQAGPVPPGARSWTVTVWNASSQPATLFVAEETKHGLMGPLIGSATPNVVAPGATEEVTFLLPAKGTDWAIFVNPGPNEGLPVAGPAEMSLAGQIYINPFGQLGWLSP